jgi:hypothetical protein
MWPKLIPQLIELLPHLKRLVPMANKFLEAKSGQNSGFDAAQGAAFEAMAEGLRGDLGQVATMHSGLYKQLQTQGAQLAEIDGALRQYNATLDFQSRRVQSMEEEITAMRTWLKSGMAVLCVLMLVVVGLSVALLRTR